jgi:hypothetical protein
MAHQWRPEWMVFVLKPSHSEGSEIECQWLGPQPCIFLIFRALFLPPAQVVLRDPPVGNENRPILPLRV